MALQISRICSGLISGHRQRLYPGHACGAGDTDDEAGTNRFCGTDHVGDILHGVHAVLGVDDGEIKACPSQHFHGNAGHADKGSDDWFTAAEPYFYKTFSILLP